MQHFNKVLSLCDPEIETRGMASQSFDLTARINKIWAISHPSPPDMRTNLQRKLAAVVLRWLLFNEFLVSTKWYLLVLDLKAPLRLKIKSSPVLQQKKWYKGLKQRNPALFQFRIYFGEEGLRLLVTNAWLIVRLGVARWTIVSIIRKVAVLRYLFQTLIKAFPPV